MPSPILAAASGAGDGLEEVLNNLMTQARLSQVKNHEDATLAESIRSHQADEDFRNRQLTEMGADRLARTQENIRLHNDQGAARQSENDARTATEARQDAEDIPGGTIIPDTDRAAMTMRAGGAGPLLRAVGPRPAVTEGPLEPEDTGEAVPQPSVIKLSSSAQKKQQAADTAAGRKQDEVERHDQAMENKPPAPDRVVVQTGDGFMTRDDVRRRLASGTDVPLPDSAQARTRAKMAGQILPHFDDVIQEINDADKAGALGPIKGRTVNDFLAGKVGSTGDDKLDTLLGGLNLDMNMLSSGVASLHGRGGANAGIGRDLLAKMNTAHMSKDELLGAVGSLRKWAAGYANEKDTAATDTPAPKKSGQYFDLQGNPIKPPQD
jgi:hypothetical protein